MVSWNKEIGYAAFSRQPIDDRYEAYIPLTRLAPIDNGIARLQNETDWIFGISELLDLSEHRVHDKRMFILNGDPIAATSSVSVHNE